jgi:hypothetical protein
MFMNITPLLLRTGVGWLLRRLILFIAWSFWWQFPVSQAWVRRTLAESYARIKEFVRRSTYIPFRRFIGYVRRESMQRLSMVLHGTLGSYLRDALHEGGAADVANLLAPRALVFVLVFFSSLLVGSTTFFVIYIYFSFFNNFNINTENLIICSDL